MKQEEIKVRNTELVDFTSCKKKYQLVWIKGYKPKKVDPKLQTGTLFHKFVELFEVIGFIEALEAMGRVYINFHDALGPDDVASRDAATKAYYMARGMAEGYAKWRETTELAPLIVAEGQFEHSLGTMDNDTFVILTGTMDGIAQDDDEDANIWLREYKTCQGIMNKLKQYPLDKQTRRYVLAQRQAGIHVRGVELVLANKMLPLEDEDFLLAKGGVSTDKKKWEKATYEQALRLEKSLDESGKKGLTTEAYHDILKILRSRDNPFFRLERLYFSHEELEQVLVETHLEAMDILRTKALELAYGSAVWTRNQGFMGMNCKSCPVKDICTMEFQNLDTSLLIAEHYEVVDPKALGEDSEEEEDTEAS